MPAEGSWFWVEGMIDLFFYIDLVLNFFVAYEVGDLSFRLGQGCWLGKPHSSVPSINPPSSTHKICPFANHQKQDTVTGDIIADQKKIAIRYLKVRDQSSRGCQCLLLAPVLCLSPLFCVSRPCFVSHAPVLCLSAASLACDLYLPAAHQLETAGLVCH